MSTTPVLGMTEMEESQSSKYVTFNEAINTLESSMPALVASVLCDMQNGDGKTNIYTVPTGKKFIPVFAVIRSPDASLAGGVDFDMGDGANADTWVNTIDLSGLTASTDFYIVSGLSAKFTIFDAADVFGIKPVTGATADAQATIDLFGYLYDA